jgi:hypothetical protein
MKTWLKRLMAVVTLALLGLGCWKFAIPTHRVVTHSELVMLGDLDGDQRWTARDLDVLAAFVRAPFHASDDLAWRLDLNQNGLIDPEDVRSLQLLVTKT